MRRTAVLVAVTLVVAFAAPAGAAKQPRSCKLLTPKQMSRVLGVDVSGPGEPGTGGFACSFDAGPGLGEPGGGLVTVTFHKGRQAKGIWSGTKPMTDAIEGSKARFYADIGTVYRYGGRQLVGVGVSFTNSDPPADELIPQMVELVELAADHR